jgi:hypothetical protein
MKMEYYVGINPEDRQLFDNCVSFLNDNEDPKYQIRIISEFDEPDGYYTFQIIGTPDTYRYFMRNANNEGFVRSLNHFEE